jgi:UDPglucose 6-dehydrogenase
MIGIIGLGFVGTALLTSFNKKNIEVKTYDKFKKSDDLSDILKCNITFLGLPTPFNSEINQYNKSPIYEICEWLENNFYKGVIVIKSTVEPETTDILSEKYKSLKILHNPEFLTARTANEDFHNQRHIVLGKGKNCYQVDVDSVETFYKENYPDAEISICKSIESETMKIFCNSFYASKIILFNEYYLLCQKNGTNFNTIKELMLKNNWINSMHTDVPGPDGKLGYGGACFPKDTRALNQYMISTGTENQVIQSVIDVCDKIRIE